MKKYWIVGFIFFAILLAVFYWFKKKQQNQSSFETIHKGSIVNSVYGIGVLTATKSFSIKSGVTSTIHHLYVKEGQAVKKMIDYLN